ncbi:MAG TPA: hypothetical protein VGD64_06795 [Acidisarcina sp.]
MKKVDEFDYELGDMPKEIDFSGGERGRYAKRFAEGTNLVPISPDLAISFPNAESVNSALRLFVEVAQWTSAAEKAVKNLR